VAKAPRQQNVKNDIQQRLQFREVAKFADNETAPYYWRSADATTQRKKRLVLSHKISEKRTLNPSPKNFSLAASF